jgi:hypothetical protein
LILDACRALLAAKLADKAIGPLRALVAADPTNRDARSLFNVTRAHSTQGKAKTRNLWIGDERAGPGLGRSGAGAQRPRDQRQLLELERSGQRPSVAAHPRRRLP